ncbi:MAG: hypothetical protein HOC09_01030, partial [Deltaproteobacteria bacterium]|nr:hypothetical protein [Deltaproteobacteria bacterium]
MLILTPLRKKLFVLLLGLSLLASSCGEVENPDAVAEAGSIDSGTTSSAPAISDISDQTIDEDSTTGDLDFTVSDKETSAEQLTVTASSSDTTLVPDSNIVLGGGGSSRKVEVTPAANEYGVATISVTVSDGSLSSATSFKVVVNSVNDAPTIATISTQYADQTISIPMTIADVDTAISSVTVSAASSNSTLIPSDNISVSGTTESRTLSLTVASGQTGNATITVSANDGSDTGTTSFQLITSPCTSSASGSILDDDVFTGDHTCGTASNDIIIENGHFIALSDNSTTLTGNIEIRSGGTLKITGTGNSISGNVDLAGGTLDIDENVSISGLISHTASSSIDVAASKVLTYTGDGPDIGANTLTLSGAGNLDKSSSTSPINLNSTSGVLNVTGTGQILASVRLVGGTLDIDESTTITGAITHVASSSLDIADTKTLIYSDTSAIQLGAFTLTIKGDGTLNNTSVLDLDNLSSVLNITGASTIQGGIQMGSNTLDIDGSCNVTGNITFSSTPTIDIAASQTFDYDGSALNLSGHTLNITNSGTLDGGIELDGGILQVTESSTLSGNITYDSDTDSTISVSSGKTFNYTGTAFAIQASSLNFTGAGTFNNTNTITLDNASSILVLNSSGATVNSVSVTGSNATVNPKASATISTLSLTDDTQLSLESSAILTVSNNMTIPGTETLTMTGTGTLKMNSSLVVNSALSVPANTILDLSGGSITLGANLTVAGNLSTDVATTTATLTADSTLTTGSDVVNFKSLDLGDKALTLGSATTDLVVNDAVAFDAGTEKIITDAADLTLTGGFGTITAGEITSTSGSIELKGAASGGTLNFGSSTLVLNGDLSIAGAVTFNHPTNLSVSTLAPANSTLTTNSETLSVTNLILNNKSLTLTTTNLTVGSAITLDDGAERIISGTNNLTLTGGFGTMTAGQITSGGGDIELKGTASGGTLDFSSSTLVLNGDLSIAGAVSFTQPTNLSVSTLAPANSTLTTNS